jgi:hypothetical protein
MTASLKMNLSEGNPFVYIRHITGGEIRHLLPAEDADIADHDDLFVVASADGQRLAIVEGREAAFAAAIAHDLTPLSVH